MGVFNFTRGGFTGSVGVHTGRNWKGKNVLSPKTAPAYSRTEKQAEVRDGVACHGVVVGKNKTFPKKTID